MSSPLFYSLYSPILFFPLIDLIFFCAYSRVLPFFLLCFPPFNSYFPLFVLPFNHHFPLLQTFPLPSQASSYPLFFVVSTH